MGRKKITRDAALAVGYCRVSTDEQAREGVSLEVQEQAVRDYAEQAGLQLLAVIRDEGVSGAGMCVAASAMLLVRPSHTPDPLSVPNPASRCLIALGGRTPGLS